MKKSNAPANKGKQLVSFTHEDAQRINASVAAHERARRGRNPSSLPRAAGGGGGGGVVTAAFLGSWLKSQKVVISFDTTFVSTNTALCSNILFSIHGRGITASRSCVVFPHPDIASEYMLINAQY